MNESNRESIRYFVEKFKSIVSDTAVQFSVIVIMVGISAFCLGRLSAPSLISDSVESRVSLCPVPFIVSPESIDVPSMAQPSVLPITAGARVDTEILSQSLYVASRNGTKYHHSTCAGAKQIKEENKLYFSSAQAAEAAGYSRAANCNK
jgi:hypothetical protein